MSSFIDIAGQRFGRLVAQERIGSNQHKQALWRCICDCGTERFVDSRSLRTGNTKSCGCLKMEKLQMRNIGESNAAWNSETVSYRALHSWVQRWKTATGTCEECGASPGYGGGPTGTQWANISGEYKRDLDDFRELCPKCNCAERVAV